MALINYTWLGIRFKLAKILIRLVCSFLNPFSPFFCHSITFYIWAEAKAAVYTDNVIDDTNIVDQVRILI